MARLTSITGKASELFRLDSNTLIRDQVTDPARRIAYEIGDRTRADEFLPQVKSCHWLNADGSNECNFSLRLVDAEPGEATVQTTADGKVEWRKGIRTARMYDLAGIAEDGGFEFEVEFSERPTSNVVSWTIQTKEFDFFLQPPLTQQQIDLGTVRPENVVGSYAVYHKSRRDNRVGGKHYRTGKAFHIYRPHAEDSQGQRVWCELNIDEINGLLTVTVPQAFLDSAVYPVIVDPTFGLTSIGATEGIWPTNDAVGGRHTLSESGDVTKLTLYTRKDSAGTANWKAVIFDDDGAGSIPGTFVASGSASAGFSTTPDWVDSDLATSLAAGDWWLIHAGNADIRSYRDEGGGDLSYDTDYDYTTPPTSWQEAVDAPDIVSIYATYTAEGGADPIFPGIINNPLQM